MVARLYQPLSKNGRSHAVDLVVVFVKLTKDVDAQVFNSLFESHAKDFQADFPDREKLNTLSVRVSDRGAQEVRSDSLGGCRFHKLDKNSGMKIYGLEFHPDQISVILGDYNRWAEDGPRIKDYLGRGLRALKDCGYVGCIKQTGLNVSDVFLLENVSKDWACQLLNASSLYLPSFIYEAESYWHSNVGFFKSVDGFKQPVLNNINVAATKSGPNNKDAFRINTAHELMLDDAVELEGFDRLHDQLLEKFHQYNKDIVSDVLASEVAKEIGIVD